MAKGRIKAILFIILFLLMLAVICNLIIDLSSNKKSEPDVTTDPYFNESPTPVPTLSVVTAAPTATPTPVPTATPVPTPTATPTPASTPSPTPYNAPVNADLGSGSFKSETGVPMNIRAVWSASALDENRVTVTVQVYLESYQININRAYNALGVSVGDQFATSDTPSVQWDKNEKLETLLGTTTHTLTLPSGQSGSFPLAVEYQFGGTYSETELPVIECGGTITLSRG